MELLTWVGRSCQAGRQQRIKAFEPSAYAAEDGRGTAAEDDSAEKVDNHPNSHAKSPEKRVAESCETHVLRGSSAESKTAAPRSHCASRTQAGQVVCGECLCSLTFQGLLRVRHPRPRSARSTKTRMKAEGRRMKADMERRLEIWGTGGQPEG